MKKTVFFLSVILFFAGAIRAQNHSKVDVAVGKMQQYYNAKQNDSMYSILSYRIKQLMTQEQTATMMDQMHTQMGNLNSYKFAKEENSFTYYDVVFANMNLTLVAAVDSADKLSAFRFVPVKKAEEKGASEIVATSNGAVLHGTLTMPETIGKVPVVLIIAGSGPTDRNGNNNAGLHTNAYHMLADSLRKAGIACVRYDKRGVAESAAALKNEADLKFDDGVDDACAFIELLNRDARFSGITIIGHSEGSLVGMLAAERGGVKKYISIAGAGEPIDNIIKWQLSVESGEMGRKAGVIMDSLKNGNNVTDIDDSLFAYFKPSIQPYMMSWLKYDPAKEIRKLKIPILLVQGENDLQVLMQQVVYLKQASTAAKLTTFHDMNHVLKDAPHDMAGNYATYNDGTLPLTKGLTAAIIGFIKK